MTPDSVSLAAAALDGRARALAGARVAAPYPDAQAPVAHRDKLGSRSAGGACTASRSTPLRWPSKIRPDRRVGAGDGPDELELIGRRGAHVAADGVERQRAGVLRAA